MSVKVMNWAWEQETPNATSKLVLIAIADHANDDGVCWPSMKSIAVKSGISTRQVSNHIGTLERLGYLTRIERRMHQGQYRGYTYQVNFQRKQASSGNVESPPAEAHFRSEPPENHQVPVGTTTESYAKRLAKDIRDKGLVLNSGKNLHETFRNLLTTAYSCYPEEQHHGITLGVIADFVCAAQGPQISSQSRSHTARLLKTHDRLKVFDAYGQAMHWGAGIGDEYEDDPMALSKYVAAIVGGKR
jgi:hypothetical protein